MSEEQAMWAAVKANPADGLPRLVLADWYDERGRSDLAYALRWSARRNKYPRVTPKGYAAVWEPYRRHYHRQDEPHLLPSTLHLRLKPNHRAKTVEAAYMALAAALGELRRIVE